MPDFTIKNKIDQLKILMEEMEGKITELDNNRFSLSRDFQDLLGQFIVEEKILAGTEWKFRVYGENLPKLNYAKASFRSDKMDPLQSVINLNSDAYFIAQLAEGITLHLDDDRASIQFSELKNIIPFCQNFELKVLPGNLIVELNRIIRQNKILEIINHGFSFTSNNK